VRGPAEDIADHARVGDLEDRGRGGTQVGKVPLLALADLYEDLFVVGEAAGGPVRIDGLPVDGDFKDPAVAVL